MRAKFLRAPDANVAERGSAQSQSEPNGDHKGPLDDHASKNPQQKTLRRRACIPAGMDDEMTLEMIQVTARTPRPIISDSVQHVSRPGDALLV